MPDTLASPRPVTLDVLHITKYHYADQVLQGRNDVWLTPRNTPTQEVLESDVAIDPTTETTSCRFDYFGNRVQSFELLDLHQDLVVTARSRVFITPRTLPPESNTPAWETVRAASEPVLGQEQMNAAAYLFSSQLVRRNQDFWPYIERSFLPGRPVFAAAKELSQRIFRDFRYSPGSTKVDTRPEVAFKERRGVCQDFAHFLIACLRTAGVPARYVSGYLRSRPGFVGAEASHAWVSFYSPGFGWIDLDPTNNAVPSTSHVVVGWGRDYQDVPPIRGISLGGGDHKIEVSVGVTEVVA
jgi:transglutaminase-like putative cysteine protease